MENKSLLTMCGDFIPAQNIVFWTDWDGVGTPPTVRENLTEEQNETLRIISSKVAFTAIITNSDPREVEKTIAKEVVDNGLCFVGEHGACAKLHGMPDFIPHPDLTVDTGILDNVYAKACELIQQSGITMTHRGEDLQTGRLFLKPERKFTSFCIVRTMNGFDKKTKADDIHRLDSVISEIMQVLDDTFGMTQYRGWTKNVGADAQEFAQSGFSKIRGIEWVEHKLGLKEKTHMMFEDSNPELLEWLGKNRNAFNYAVGDALDNHPYINRKLPTINSLWSCWGAIASDLQKFNGVRVSTIKKHTWGIAA